MRRKYLIGGVAITILAIAGIAFHLIFGYVESVQIAERVTVLTRKSAVTQIGANVVVYRGDNGATVVDTQLPPLASSTRSKVDAAAQTQIATVIITHWHPDHSGGISAFSGDSDIVAHENVLARLSVPQEGFGLTKPGSHHQFDARTSAGLPTQSVSTGLDLSNDSDTVEIVHYANAHTDGDLVVYFDNAGVAAVGDLIWPGSFPFVDAHNGGSVAGLESALRAVLARSKPGDRFVPGHGQAITYKEVSEYLEMVSGSRQWVEIRIEEGRSLEQVISAGLPENWDQWSSALVPSSVWIEMIFDSRNTLTTVRQVVP